MKQAGLLIELQVHGGVEDAPQLSKGLDAPAVHRVHVGELSLILCQDFGTFL